MVEQVANEILKQLGGFGRLKAMVGIHNAGFSKGQEAFDRGQLSFKFKGSKVANYCTITLAGDDTYRVYFSHYNRRTFVEKNARTVERVYAEDLKGLFEEHTGLYLTI